MSATSYGWLVLAFPLAGTLVIALGWRVLPGRLPGWIGTAAIFLAFLSAIGALFDLLDQPEEKRQLVDSAWTYAATSDLHVDLAILVDPLSLFMCLVVSGVSFLIHLYSVAYMSGDRGYPRYFAYLNFFVFSMLLLVLAANFVILIVGWAFVGAASYLLISYWYRRTTAVAAGIKAFVINVIGDVGLVIATFLILDKVGSVDFLPVFDQASDSFGRNDGTLVAACLLLLVGAFAKSAQLPLHTWLPDAMEGPTPVSALIHAATMVTAGVYLIARMHPLFELAPTAADVGAIVGCATLLFAGTVALVQTDLKRVIAYSTISQIGYMVMGVSFAAYGAGLFHLMTHAFFKALLFMGAGSIIGAMAGVQDMDRMGGFRRAMPFTFLTFAVGALALAGFPLTAGFFSKDEIIAFGLHRGGLYAVLAVLGYIGAFLTAFYSFRMVFRVFFGDPVPEALELERGHVAHGEPMNPMTGEPEDTDVGFPGPEHHVAERAWPMKAAMGPLALLAIVGGYLAVPGLTDVIEKFLEPTFQDSRFHDTAPTNGSEVLGLVAGGIISVLGIAGAWWIYRRRPGTTARLVERFPRAHRFLGNKWYFDELYDSLFVRPVTGAASFSRRVIEHNFVQGTIVGGATGIVRVGTSFARAIQTGYLRAYALLLLLGAAGLTLYFLITSS
ncbi:MAG TPA: NADH-quinone oxidoreductase subunit L [Thermoleophilaceae bacterium]|jgi:NADH-quinone oxidoreductase subunit L|nr:NADH-quinone oxidoreductase subunit L [Thermoleophilaceae bacterium]